MDRIKQLLEELETTDLTQLTDQEHIEYHDKRTELYRLTRGTEYSDQVYQAILNDNYRPVLENL